MRRAQLLLAPALIALLLANSTTAASRLFKCRDGILAPPTRVCRPPFCSCDADQACDGVCTFVIPVFCEVTCATQTFMVPVGQKLALPARGTPRLILRCQRHPKKLPCPTTSTATSTTVTTTMPCPTNTTAADWTCSPAVCGNGVRDVGEQCDGADLACGTLFNAGCVPPGLPNECQCCGLDGALCVNGFGCCPGYPCVSNGGPLGLGSCAAPGSCGSLLVVCGFSGLPCCPGLVCAPPNGFPDYPYTFCCEPPGASCTDDLACCVGTCAGGVCS